MASSTSSTAVRATSRAPAVLGQTVAVPTNRLRYADVGINLGDPIFRGVYHGKKAHDDDLEDILQRSVEAGCVKLMITGSDLKESRKAVELAKEHPGLCYATIGVHPCSASSFDKYRGGPSALLQEIESLALESKASGLATAFGEIGLDYDRLHFAPKEVQLKYFEAQLDVAVKVQLPLFLHSRAAHDDFERLLKARLHELPKRGLVHSFTGTGEEMRRCVDMGFSMGVNGCSLKSEDSLEVVRNIPMERLMIETDGPWCDMRPSHASAKYLEDAPPLPKAVKKEKWQRGLMVKGRNEPATISNVAHVVGKLKGLPVEEVCHVAWQNCVNMFGLGENGSQAT